MIILVFYICSA